MAGMLEGLRVYHYPAQGQNDQARSFSPHSFVINTCQRTLVCDFIMGIDLSPQNVSPEVLQGPKAYRLLLEVLCGLHSKMLGENEIVGQFKLAYQNYLRNPHRLPQLMPLLEKLFKDAKEIRSQHLMAIGQQSYSGLSRKILQMHAPHEAVTIIGSGQLASDLVMALGKHHPLKLLARNSLKAQELQQKVPALELLSWEDFQKQALFSCPVMVNTIGGQGILFDQAMFKSWKEKFKHSIFIDLGHPSVIHTPYQKADGIFRLGDLFHLSHNLSEEKKEKISKAQMAIDALVAKRQKSFSWSLAFGWEELQFAQ